MTESLNEQHTFAPHDVAGMFNVSVMTVRRWADYHKLHLSDVANPPPGKARAFTWADVEKFRQIKAWRDAGLSVEAINNRLSVAITEAVTATVMDVSSTAIQATQEAQDDASAITMALHAINTLQRRVEVLEQSKPVPVIVQRDGSTFALGFIAALLFMIVIVGLAVLYGR